MTSMGPPLWLLIFGKLILFSRLPNLSRWRIHIRWDNYHRRQGVSTASVAAASVLRNVLPTTPGSSIRCNMDLLIGTDY